MTLVERLGDGAELPNGNSIGLGIHQVGRVAAFAAQEVAVRVVLDRGHFVRAPQMRMLHIITVVAMKKTAVS